MDLDRLAPMREVAAVRAVASEVRAVGAVAAVREVAAVRAVTAADRQKKTKMPTAKMRVGQFLGPRLRHLRSCLCPCRLASSALA